MRCSLVSFHHEPHCNCRFMQLYHGWQCGDHILQSALFSLNAVRTILWILSTRLNHLTLLFSSRFFLINSKNSTIKPVKYISNAICYTMLYMLEWMRNEKHRIGTLKTRVLHDSAYVHRENFYKDYIFLVYKSIV